MPRKKKKKSKILKKKQKNIKVEKIVEVLWRIILSDNNSDMYEGSLMRRICGLFYIPDKLSGEIKLKIMGKNN